ncbi:hypothetical protein K432DRAFT_427162 [Lepidopterella palustris CBS 459.81]|uniref:Exocyst complex component Sec8 n=1 Tax=Lepidopterella palustris CBS 459.81 TaxID=1314670 RepID=A0A8E2E756_9PEZI|nr:hypothetical protein K432DRAFT_427162 [Lepidopterella palustris CBS 459.81]
MSRVPPSLRAGGNGSGGYTNGYSNDGPPNQYSQNDNDVGTRARIGAERRNRERRPGGYGGFTSPEPEDEAPHVTRPTSLERTQAHRRSGDRYFGPNQSRSRSRPDAGRYTDGSHQIEEVLQSIKRDWEFMTEDNCVPVQISLKLLDSSSLGLANRYNEFCETHRQLQNALKAIVNEHHQGFNSSIGTFHKIQTSLQTSQTRVRHLKDSLLEAKSNLSTTKPELKDFATSSQGYDDMIQVLHTIEQLQLVPEKLEARISEKRFLTAVEILQDALRIIRKSEMEGIGALSDLRVYLSNQEHSLTDILIEELHSHLYLKSPYCEDRWKPYAHNQAKTRSANGSVSMIDSRGRTLYYFLEKLDTAMAMTDDSSRNPEADTFHYIQLIIEALNKMNRLDIAIDTIEQRLPVELFKVVEKSNNEVAQRHPSILRAYANKSRGKTDVAIDSDDARTALLHDLLWTLYARFEAIAEGHRVVHDVVAGIAKRENLRDAPELTRGFKELWKLYQSEIRSLLHDYLATDGDLTYRSSQSQQTSGSVFQKNQRDRTKRMFKLSDMDVKSTELATERDDLEFILKSSVPGLVSDSKRSNGVSADHSTTVHDGSATGHKLLVVPSVFNMGILLPPSLDFLNRLKEVVPPDSDIVMSTLTSFLDDFLVNVFHPQLDETLVDLCAQTFIELDAFQQDSQWSRHSKKPIFKGTTKFFSLITAFCKMLDNLPHDQAFSQLIITQMSTYYDKCSGWYKALVTRSQGKSQTGRLLKASAAFAEDGDLQNAVSALFETDKEKSQDKFEQEVILLLSKTDAEPLEESDLIMDRKTVASLCLLHTSMKWLASKVGHLRHISDRATDSSRLEHGKPKHNRRWTMVASTEPRADGVPVYLPLNADTADEFDSVVRSYQQLAATVLRCLHLEIRCRILHQLRVSIKDNYLLEQELNDADPDIISLNSDLVAFDEDVSNHLTSQQHSLITSGLAQLMDRAILQCSSHITVMNANGCNRMQLNILVLQQNLRNIEPTALLPRSAAFFDFFTAGPDAIIARAKETGGKGLGFGYEELKGLVELTYSEALGSDRREVSMQAKRAMDDRLLQLSEHLWSS